MRGVSERELTLILLLSLALHSLQAPQNPSPMVEHTREHRRLKEDRPVGRRIPLKIGTLFLPDRLRGDTSLVVHFHGPGWIPEIAAARKRTAVITVQIGSGSGVYAKPFADSAAFGELLKEAEERAGRKFNSVGLTAWSAGYGAVREILTNHYDRIQSVLLLDGLHCSYVDSKPGPAESALETEDLAVFLRLAREALTGKKHFTITHTEIFPGTFASTTETADYLLKTLGIRRRPVLRWGPMGTQVLSDTKKAGFRILGFAGNSAPDHVDLLHSLPEFMREWERMR